MGQLMSCVIRMSDIKARDMGLYINKYIVYYIYIILYIIHLYSYEGILEMCEDVHSIFVIWKYFLARRQDLIIAFKKI